MRGEVNGHLVEGVGPRGVVSHVLALEGDGQHEAPGFAEVVEEVGFCDCLFGVGVVPGGEDGFESGVVVLGFLLGREGNATSVLALGLFCSVSQRLFCSFFGGR